MTSLQALALALGGGLVAMFSTVTLVWWWVDRVTRKIAHQVIVHGMPCPLCRVLKQGVAQLNPDATPEDATAVGLVAGIEEGAEFAAAAPAMTLREHLRELELELELAQETATTVQRALERAREAVDAHG